MKVVIRHSKHHDWAPLKEGEKPGNGEQTRPLHPDRPDVLQVRRLVDSDPEVHFTEMDIPEEGFAESLKNYVAVNGGGEPTEAHRRRLLARHIEDIVHQHHSPSEHWTDIEVEGDPKLSAWLKRRLMMDDDVDLGASAAEG